MLPGTLLLDESEPSARMSSAFTWTPPSRCLLSGHPFPTQTKAQRLFDANKAELFTQSCADLDKWLHGLESQIQSDDYGKDLTSVNILLKKQQASAWAGALQAVSPLWSWWSQLAHRVLRHSLGV